MKNYKILNVVNKKFSLLELENILQKQLPGRYKLIWHTQNNESWEITLYWDGTNYIDLYQNI